MDPLAAGYASWSPYNYVLGNPISHTDPDGRSVDGEYELDNDGNWVKVSKKGDKIGLDFYHEDNVDIGDGKVGQVTTVKDRQGNSNKISNGRYVLSGKERNSNVGWNTIYEEFMNGTGPERSVFIGRNDLGEQIASGSEHSDNFEEFVNSDKPRQPNIFEGNFIWGKALTGNTRNGLQLFIGSYNYSFYKLGDRVLTIVQDSKSKESLNYGRHFKNYSRTEGAPTTKLGTRRGFGPNYNFVPGPTRTQKQTTTYQSYLWLR